MNTKKNRRYKDTEALIENSYLQLLSEHAGENISIRAICDRAGVNRSTFYSHFEDIFDLQTSIEKKYIRKLISISGGTGSLYAWSKNFYMLYLQYVKENRLFFILFLRNYLVAIERSDYVHYLDKHGFADHPIVPLWEMIDMPGRETLSLQERKFTFAYHEAGISMCILQWLLGDCKESVEDICDVIIKNIMI